MKLLAITALLGSVSAQGVPIWEASQSWICKADSARYCDEKPNCPTEAGQAVFTVNFATGLSKPISSPPEYAEKIVGRKFHESKFGDSHAKIWLDGGDSIAFSATPKTGPMEDGRGYGFVASRVSFKGQNLYYGTCYPA